MAGLRGAQDRENMAKAKPLIIVESPAKTRTLKNFLGGDFEIQASMGHVRDLPKSEMGIDIEHGFQPRYVIPRDRAKVVKALREAAGRASEVYLASDPDREGEAIAWHVAELLGVPDARRIEFNAITRDAVLEAFKHPRSIDRDRVNAQQARRVLDRLVGYRLSPLLWKKLGKRTLSAGRVQSVALRLICDREREIQAFVPVEYWTITATLTTRDENHPFDARLAQIDGRKAEIGDAEQAQAIVRELDGAEYRVARVETKERLRNAPAPFITSTLQQEAARKLGFTASRTMRVAQDLYEGVELPGEGSVGLITYLRTDSTRVAPEAVEEARAYIRDNYGPQYLPEAPRAHRKSKAAQDAHEAIRPTKVLREPDSLKAYLSDEHYRLYRLIWQRFVASQMSPAVYDVETVDISAGRFTFRATGSVEKFDGFRRVYTEGRDETPAEPEDEDRPPLPEMAEGELLELLKLLPEQHFTEPPPRYTEATLVRALEEHGIGRPSTYAGIISTLKEKDYVRLEKKRFHPTALGFAVSDRLVEHFPGIMDVKFTAGVEAGLDEIEKGRTEWTRLVSDFYGPFEEALKRADAEMERVRLEPERTDLKCPNCGADVVVRDGRFGKFLACSRYPDCKTIIKERRETGVSCPSCGEGHLVERKSRRGKVFYGCDRYPSCEFVLWDRPAGESCPECGSLLVEKVTKSRGREIRCSSRDCGYSRPAGEQEDPDAPEVTALAS
jgi:DNA topoisomerase-1